MDLAAIAGSLRLICVSGAPLAPNWRWRYRKGIASAADCPMTPTEKNEGYRTANEMADRQREISGSEFFRKNRHLLGFDSGAKALVTTVKEAVDNALDACEEAGILPELRVEVVDV